MYTEKSGIYRFQINFNVYHHSSLYLKKIKFSKKEKKIVKYLQMKLLTLILYLHLDAMICRTRCNLDLNLKNLKLKKALHSIARGKN